VGRPQLDANFFSNHQFLQHFFVPRDFKLMKNLLNIGIEGGGGQIN